MKAQYQCVKCFQEWELPFTVIDPENGKKINPADRCPQCGSVYFIWVNSKEVTEQK